MKLIIEVDIPDKAFRMSSASDLAAIVSNEIDKQYEAPCRDFDGDAGVEIFLVPPKAHSNFAATLNECETCSHCVFPGVRWPASPDGSSAHSFVERCDICERYSGDIEAANALGRFLGERVGWAMRSAEIGQQWVDEPQWLTEPDSRGVLHDVGTLADSNDPGAGWSPIVEDDDRDDETYWSTWVNKRRVAESDAKAEARS